MIPLFKVHMPEKAIEEVSKTLRSGYVGEGPKVKEFEQKLSNYLQINNILTINTGTSAIILALRLANIKPEDEVISTPMTSMATNCAIRTSGADIIWADIDEIGNISPESIKQKITDKTKAIVCVDFGGVPCDMDEINKIAKEHNIKVIHDCAHSLGAKYKSKPTGSLADFTIFSLQAIKHITTVDGGLLICKDNEDHKKAKKLRWYGIDREEKNREDFRIELPVDEWGYKFHMNDVAATIGIEQLPYLNDILKKHRDNAKFYDEKLSNLKNIKTVKYKNDRLSSYWLYLIKIKPELQSKFREFMEKNNITASRVFERNDIHPTFEKYKTNLPNLSNFVKEMICIPVGWWVTNEDREYIKTKIIEFDNQN